MSFLNKLATSPITSHLVFATYLRCFAELRRFLRVRVEKNIPKN